MGTQKRQYESSHPWLTFECNLVRVSYSFWMKLGAIQSKCEQVSHVLLPPDVAQELLVLYLGKGVRATTAIEGNTLSEEDVRQRIEGRRELPPSKEYQGQEIDNVVQACNEVGERMTAGEAAELSLEGICRFNELILRDLPLDEGVVPGRIRQTEVGVANYKGTPPGDCYYLLEKLCHWINDEIRPPSDEQQVAFGVIKAVLAHLYVAWIHPFADGNGRTARLVEFQILLAAGVPNIAAHLLSNHYNLTRAEYYRQLDRASRSQGNVFPFLEYAIQGILDGLDEQIEQIRRHQWWTTWKAFVHEKFRDMQGAAANRRRQLALDIAQQSDDVTVSDIRRLSPALAEMYANKTQKTVDRDLNALTNMDLVQKERGKVRANFLMLLSLLPEQREPRDRV